MATTLERAAFANQAGGRVLLTLVARGAIAAGDPLTVTVGSGQSAGATLTGTVKKLIGANMLKLGVTAVSKPSGLLLLPKGSGVA
jgi:hypothetical protein